LCFTFLSWLLSTVTASFLLGTCRWRERERDEACRDRSHQLVVQFYLVFWVDFSLPVVLCKAFLTCHSWFWVAVHFAPSPCAVRVCSTIPFKAPPLLLLPW
jgi:hypothetical protein